MSILAIDPAKMTGFAYSDVKDRVEASGVWNIGTDPESRPGHLAHFLRAAIKRHKPHIIAYESASFGSHHLHVMRRHNELAGVIMEVASEAGIKYCWAFNPTSWKARAIGQGNAKKYGVIRGLITYYGIVVSDDNEADAIGVLFAAQQGPPGETKRKRKSRERKAAKRNPQLFY